MSELQKIENLPAEVTAITTEINVYKAQAGACIVEIGKRLIRAKELLPHGQWAAWLSQEVEFSERTAQRFMKVAESYKNPTALSDLGLTKAFLLLQVPESEREQFTAASHEVDGKEKSVQGMSTRELEKVIRERDEARKQAEIAKADAEKWKNTAAAKDISLQNANDKVKKSTEAAKAAAARESELTAKIKELEESARAEPIQAEVIPDEETLNRIREEVLAGQAKAIEEANARAADATARLEKAKNPTALRVSLWFADVQALVVKLEASLMELHNQQPETAYKFRDAISGFLTERAARLKEINNELS